MRELEKAYKRREEAIPLQQDAEYKKMKNLENAEVGDSRKKRLAVFVSGKGSNLAALFDSTQQGELQDLCTIELVVSNRADAGALAYARLNQIDCIVHESKKDQPREEYDRELIAKLKPYDIDLVVLAGFMRILSPVFLAQYMGRVVNIHPADTAKYKGSDGYGFAWEKKLEETWITVHLVDEGVDTGQVLGKAKVNLRGVQTLDEIVERGLAVEHVFYSHMIAKLLLGQLDAKAFDVRKRV